MKSEFKGEGKSPQWKIIIDTPTPAPPLRDAEISFTGWRRGEDIDEIGEFEIDSFVTDAQTPLSQMILLSLLINDKSVPELLELIWTRI